MNISCDIIKDLLPIYHDGMCSDDSKRIVAEHLSQCEKCCTELTDMDDILVIPQMEENIAEAHKIMQLSKRWKKEMVKSALKVLCLHF